MELRHQIEQLIRDGKFDRFILNKPKNQQNRGDGPRRDNQRRPPQPRNDTLSRRENQLLRQKGEKHHHRGEEAGPSVGESDNEPIMDRIYVISGGENLAGDSSSAQKAYAHQALHVDSVARVQEDEDPIIFTPKDQGESKARSLQGKHRSSKIF